MANTKETEEQRRNREMVEAMAKNISDLAKSVSSVVKGPLNRKTLLLLLAHSSGQSQKSVEAILVALSNMERDWLK